MKSRSVLWGYGVVREFYQDDTRRLRNCAIRGASFRLRARPSVSRSSCEIFGGE